MNIQTRPDGSLLHCSPTTQGTLICKPISEEEAKNLTVVEAGKQIQVDGLQQKQGILHGLLPTGKGLLAGGAAGAISGSVLASAMVGIYGDFTVGGAASTGGVVGGVLGAGAGIISASLIDNKAVNVAVGAVIGGMSSSSVGAGWLLGSLAGGAGTLAGLSVMQKK